MSEPTFDTDDFIKQRRLPDKRLLAVEPLTFGRARLCIGEKPPLHDVGIYANSWDYLSVGAALCAFETWNPVVSPEPDGWNRHPFTGRYRIGGRSDLEYVKGEGTTKKQVKHAVQVTQGHDRVILDVKKTPFDGGSIPEGAQCFVVHSESATCTHDPRCQWHDSVYHYLDRSVVLSSQDEVRVTLATLITRLTL